MFEIFLAVIGFIAAGIVFIASAVFKVIARGVWIVFHEFFRLG